MAKVIKLDQRVEIIAQDVEELKNSGGGGGTPSDSYTKAEADAKFETIANAASTYQTISGMSSYGTKTWVTDNFQAKGDYLTPSSIADMATKTWVGQQGFLTDANEVPAPSSAAMGKVLTCDSANSYDWVELPAVREVPTSSASDSGKVLTVNNIGTPVWETAASGGLSVETDGTNYWITVNGIRLYFGTTAPTGNIPANSYGIGW